MRIAWLICLAFIVNVGVAQKTFVGVKAGGHVSTAFIEHTIFNLNLDATFLPGVNGGVFVRYLPKPGKSFFEFWNSIRRKLYPKRVEANVLDR